FQAEDGIRDFHVTGVQTCALPICSDELKEIVFNDIEGNLSHKTVFKDTVPDYRNVIGFFTASILKDSRLVSGFNILYPKVESFIKYQLFTNEVELSDPQTLRNHM